MNGNPPLRLSLPRNFHVWPYGPNIITLTTVMRSQVRHQWTLHESAIAEIIFDRL